MTLSFPNPLRPPRPSDFILSIFLPIPPRSPTQWLHCDALLIQSFSSSFTLITSLGHLLLSSPLSSQTLWLYPDDILTSLFSSSEPCCLFWHSPYSTLLLLLYPDAFIWQSPNLILLILLTLLSLETLSWQYPHFSPGPQWLYPSNIILVLLKPNDLTVNLSLAHPPPSPAPWWLHCAISFPHLPRPPRPRDSILTISTLVTLIVSSSSFSWTRWCLLLWHSAYLILLDPGDFIVTLSLSNPLGSPRPCDFIMTISLPHSRRSPTQWLHCDVLLS